MAKYLGEEILNIEDTPFKDYTIQDWTLYFIGRDGMDDGAHHKHELLDTIARINNGQEIQVFLEKWDSGKEYYIVKLTKDENEKYDSWAEEYDFYSEN